MKVDSELVRAVLEVLYNVSFPDPCGWAVLRPRIVAKASLKDDKPIRVALLYLEDKGLAQVTRDKEGGVQYRITGLGIDKVQGRSVI